jgi:hypothetical protein
MKWDNLARKRETVPSILDAAIQPPKRSASQAACCAQSLEIQARSSLPFAPLCALEAEGRVQQDANLSHNQAILMP